MPQIALALQSSRLNREFLRQGTQELTQRAVGFVDLVERERRLFAADLHDQILPDLRALLSDLEATPSFSSPVAPPLSPSLTPPVFPLHQDLPVSLHGEPTPREMAHTLKETMANIRDMMESLRPSALEMLGLIPAMESELRKATSRQRPPLVPVFSASEEARDQKFNAFIEVSLFRIMQEAVNNACRHAKAKSVWVQIGVEEGEWWMQIEDDGIGLPPEDRRKRGNGLENMQYRANLIGARLTWKIPDTPQGTLVELRLSLRRANTLENYL